VTDQERLEKKFKEERERALPPYITREERTINALEKISDGIDKLRATILEIHLNGGLS
jgi:hypothetical protein